MQEIDQAISKIFKLAERDINDDLSMKDVPGWDSLSHMNLIAEFETKYGFELSGDEIADMQSIGLVRSILSQHIKESS